MSKHIFLTGGSGFVGRNLIPALIREGHAVSALARSETSAERVAALGARPVRASLGVVPTSALEGVDVIVHAAAKAEDWGPLAEFEAVNVDGTRQLLEAARASAVARFVHISSESVHFRGRDLADIDEDAPLAPDSPFPYAATKARAEQVVLAARDLETVILRPRLIWGRGDTTILPVLEEAAKKGAFRWVDGGQQQISTTHIDNLVDAIVIAVEGSATGIFCIADDETHRARDFLSRYAARAGIALPNKSVPGWLLRFSAGTFSVLWRTLRLKGRPPVTPMAAAMLSSTVTIKNARAKAQLDWRPRVDFEAGLAAM